MFRKKNTQFEKLRFSHFNKSIIEATFIIKMYCQAILVMKRHSVKIEKRPKLPPDKLTQFTNGYRSFSSFFGITKPWILIKSKLLINPVSFALRIDIRWLTIRKGTASLDQIYIHRGVKLLGKESYRPLAIVTGLSLSIYFHFLSIFPAQEIRLKIF